MSVRTTEQLVGDRIIERIKTEGNLNVTTIIDPSVDALTTSRQEEIADAINADTAFTSRKTQTVPDTFGANDAILVLGNSEPFLTTSRIKEKLRLAADVRFIICWHSFFKDDEFENFELISDENIVKSGTFARGERIEYPLKVFQRRKVFVS